MAFLHQLRLLLWKNGLGIIRQPLWSLTLIIWPLIIFIIIAVTRQHFPPIVKDTCYVGPRNLPSTGFFPFLQTLMCNTDSHCHNTSRLVDPTESKTNQRSSAHESWRGSQWGRLMSGEDSLDFAFLKDPKNEPAALVRALLDMIGTSGGSRQFNASFMSFNESFFGDNETLHSILESANRLKKVICLVTLPMTNTSSPSPVSQAVVTFCKSNETVFEVTLNLLDEVMSELIQTKPDDIATIAGMTLVVFHQLQNETSLWESLLALPKLFTSGSIDQIFDSAESLISNIQGAMKTIQNKFPEAGVPLSMLDPGFAVGLKIIHHAQKWPGSDVSIPLKEVVILHNDSLSEMVKQALPQIQIPLEQAIPLTLNRDFVHAYLCTKTNNPLWLATACTTGTVGMLLDWISPEKVAQQALLAWSKHVAVHDVAFAKELLQSLMGESAPGDQGGPPNTRTRRSVETQPQNIEEELFLALGDIVLDIIQIWPEADMIVNSVLRSGLQSMKIAILTLETVDEIITNVLNDADQLKQTYLMLVTNQTETSEWFSRVLGGAIEVIMKVLKSDSLTCEDVLKPFDWLLSIETVQIEGFSSLICQNGSDLQRNILTLLMPLIESAEDFNSTILADADNKVPLPVILSTWRKMFNNSVQFIGLVETLAEELGGAYWMNWMPDNSTHNVTGTLQQSVLLFMVHLGKTIEESHLWPEVQDYFHIVNWILMYTPHQPAPHNCFLNIFNSTIDCNTDFEFNWPQFVSKMTQTLTSADQDIVVNSLKGAVNLLQDVYRDTLTSAVGSFLKGNIKGGDGLSSFLITFVQNLQSFINKLSMLNDENIADPNTIMPLVANMLQSSGLAPLLPLISSDGPFNVSNVLHAAIKLLRDNQHIFTFNETDPTMPELGRLIMHFLSLKGNLSILLPNNTGDTLLSYTGYFNPVDVARLKETIRPFTNQTSAGVVEAILSAVELLESVLDPNGDPTQAILEYIRQLQIFIMSLLRLEGVRQSVLPNGNLSAAQLIDLQLASKEILDLLTEDKIQSLIQAGPDDALDTVIEKFVKFLPAHFQQEFKALQQLLAKCASGQDCLSGISDIFEFLDQILEMMQGAQFGVKITAPKPLSNGQEYQEIASAFFSLLLSPHEAAYVKTFQQALKFINLVTAMPNITISDVHMALKQSNLILEELKELSSLFGAANIDELQKKIMDVINSQKCFEVQDNQMAAPQCVMGLTSGIADVLTQLPELKNQTAILSLIPSIVNKTISDVLKVNFSSSPNEAIIHTLDTTLDNVKMALQQNNLYTPEVMKEIRVLEGLIRLAANQEALSNVFNDTLTSDPIYAQKVYLEVVQWYLERLKNITKESSLAELFQPFLRLITMQVKLQLVQTDFSVLLSNHIEYLMNNLQNPINHAGVSKIGQTVVEILHHLLKLIRHNLEFQNNVAGMELFNITALHAAEQQIKHYLDIVENCFELQQDQMVTPQCVDGLTNGVTGLLRQLPLLQNKTEILNLIPQIINETIKDIIKTNFSLDPQKVVIHTLNTTLENVKMALQSNNLYTPEVMKEVRVLEGLIRLAANQEALSNVFNDTLTSDPIYAQKVYLEVAQWYLERLKNITMDSSLAEPIQPFLQLAIMQVKLQLVQTDFTLLVTKRVEHLMSTIQQPIDGAMVTKIGQTAVEIAQHLFKLIKGNLEFQNNLLGMQLFNTTVLDEVGDQMKLYLDVIQGWMKNPKVPLVLSSMLQWGNITSVSTPLKDIHHLLQTIVHFLNKDQQAFLSLASNITQSLSNALMAAEKPGGLQSPDFLDALDEAVQSVMQILTSANIPVPPSVEKNIREIVQNSLKLILQLDMNYDNSRIISLEILKTAESVIKELLPETVTEYLLPGIKVIATYFESGLMPSGSDAWNQLILNELKTVQSLLPPNSTAGLYIYTLINITTSILESDQGNFSLWTLLEMALEGNVLQIGNISNIFDPIKDLQQLLQTVVPFLNKEQQAYLSLIGNITQSLSNAVMAAEKPGGLQSQDFLDALDEAVQSVMQILTSANIPVPPSVEKNIREIVQNSLKLILQPDMNYDNSRIISLEILKTAESVIKELLPETVTEYLLPGIKVIATYFESGLMPSGSDAWNQLILNELTTVQSLLPPNSTAGLYISTLINITTSILESDQGNFSLWTLLEMALEGNVLQMGNISNIFDPIKDLQQLLQTVVPFLNKEQRAYLSLIRNITQSLSNALMAAEKPGGLQSQDFLDALDEAVQSVMQILTSANIPVPPSVEKNIREIVQNSLKLILQPDMNYDNSRIISLEILKTAESVIQKVLPETVTEYLLPGIKVIATYFESGLMPSGQDAWNQLILNEMKTVQSLLPPNSPAQVYISTLINITNFILESGQGNMSIWALFENASEENMPLILGKVGKLVSMLWPLITGGTGSHTGPPSFEGFEYVAAVLDQILSGMADQATWDKLEEIIEALLPIIKETELWESVPPAIPLFEKIVGSLVNNMQAENVLIHSLQVPMVTLMKEIMKSVNSSHLNLTEVSERMQDAIQHTVQAAQQANSSLTCSEVFKIWDPTREAAGLSQSTMIQWCRINLQPVFEAYSEALIVFGHMNMSHMGARPLMVNATAARIVRTLQSVYQVSVNRTVVAEKLIMAFSNQLSMLTGQPLSPEAQKHWNKQLQEMLLQNSLASLQMLTEQLLMVAPSLHPYIEAGEKALRHILINYHRIQNESSFDDIFGEAVKIFLLGAGITSEDISSLMHGNFSDLDKDSLTHMIQEAVKHLMKLLEDVPMVSKGLEHFLSYNDTKMMVEETAELLAWLASSKGFNMDQLEWALPKIFRILRPLFSALTQIFMDPPAHTELFEDLADNIAAMIGQIMSTSGLLGPMDYHHGIYMQGMKGSNHTKGLRHKRESPYIPMRSPVEDFIDLFQIDYPTMFKAMSVSPTDGEILETAHMFFANPDLSLVMKGMTRDMPWYVNASREDTIDAAVDILSYITLPDVLDKSFLELLMNAAKMLPDGFPLVPELKAITKAFAKEDKEKLLLMEETFKTIAELLQINLADPAFIQQLGRLETKVCAVEEAESVLLLMKTVGLEPGFFCDTLIPGLQFLVKTFTMDMKTLTDALFETFIGDPSTYNIDPKWTSVLSAGLSFNISSLSSLNINITSPGAVTLGEMLRNKTAFIVDVQRHTNLDPTALQTLMETTLPNNNLVILSWLVNLRHCDSIRAMNMDQADLAFLKTFCSMPFEDWYSFSLLMARHLNIEKLIFRIVLSDEMQSFMEVMLQMAEVVINMLDKIAPAVEQIQSYISSMQDLDLEASSKFHHMTRVQRSTDSNRASFVTLSRALCSNGIMALFGLSKLPLSSDESDPSSQNDPKREEMIERFKLPRNASPFCMNMYLEMVNTTGGAIAWAFLKPMLMGHILYTPDTPVTREIMRKSQATLQELADLRKHSGEWIESSGYILKAAEILGHTLPMLQNSLGNSFVKNFIEMQTDINVGTMKETLSSFSNITLMLEKNRDMLDQITTLSTLMVNISSCVKFDRYRGYDSVELLNADAEDLAKNRDLYASVIFKLPKDNNSSRKRRAAPSTSSLPPKVSYTIRMHMDNVMRSDRVRDPFFVKDHHISASLTMRYNRGFIYLQETIDRAIIATQTGKTVTEPAVQLQPFPYPCHHRDEYLEAVSFVFPLMLMIAWVLFVADFVKKLVYERELRLHEYMKMMGVNPLSHFFAWFLECSAYLLSTIAILTIVLKYGSILPHSDGFLLFLYFCNYGLSVLAFSFLISSFFDKTFIAGLSGSLLYILSFFPFIVVMAVERNLTFSQKSLLSLFSPTCFSYASQYISRYESQAEGIQWSNMYTSPVAGDTASFGWLCWLMLIDAILYFIIGSYIRMVFPGKYGIPAPWYFPFKASFWAELFFCVKSNNKQSTGLLFTNIMQGNQPVFFDDKGKDQSTLSSQTGESYSHLPVGVALHGLTKIYGDQAAIHNLNVSFYEGHVTSLLGHNGAGKTTTMSLLTGLFAPTSGSIEVYGRDMQSNIDDIRKELGVCMQYDVLFDHMTTKEHLLLYGQIKAPHWSQRELREQVRTILEETGMYAHRHKRVGTLSGGMKRKLSISIAFIGGSRLVVLDEPTTGVDPCSRRAIWDIVIQHKKQRTIIMSTHHLDEAEVLSDRITFLERGGLKCCGSPFYLKDKLGQGYKLTLTKKMQNLESEKIDNADLKNFIQAHIPEARLKDAQGGDLVYSLPPFTSSNASAYRSLLTALDSNLDALQLGGYGVSDTTLEEVFLQLAHDNTEPGPEDSIQSISETVSDTGSISSFPSNDGNSDHIKLTSSTTMSGVELAWQQLVAMLTKRIHHSRRDWKGLIAQILLPVLFMVFAMGLGSIRNDLQHYPELELSPALYKFGQSYSFFSNSNPNSEKLPDAMMSFPGIDNFCLNNANNPVCSRSAGPWRSSGNSSKAFSGCKCTRQEQICETDSYQPPHKTISSSQIVYNLSGINVERYLMSTANDFIRNRYGGFAFGMPLPTDLKMDIKAVPKNRTLSKVWFNPEGHHTMPAYLNSINNFILRANLPADKDPREYAISVSSHPYFGRADDEDAIIQGMLQILVAMCVLTGYSITTASFAIYVVNEHHSGLKRLQHIAGISEPFYWAVNFFYDMAVYMIPVALTVGVIAAFQIPAFTAQQNLGAVALLLVLFGFATFPWMYLISGIFKDVEMAFITFVCINLFISINTILSTSILFFLSQISTMKSEVIQVIFTKLCNTFLIFPQFNFGHGMMQLARKNIEVQILSGYGIDAYQNPFSMEALGWLFISSFIQGVVFFSLRLLLNKSLMRQVRRLICGRKTVPHLANEREDEDVATEHLRVSSGAAGSDILQVNQLTKVYQNLSKKVHAVKRVSVGIPAGECFGLLGVNGAGKTTTFKMLTGDISPTDGTAQIRDRNGCLIDIMECRNQGINIGYCPQVDALDNLLTGEEHLYFYARIRGISKREIDGVVRYLLKRLELNRHRDITTEAYSCGTRRKLSTALALIGHPQILLLDEPSSGMDPHTKRHLWKILSEEVKGKCAVVLTSHSMEECEALCSRLAIMVKGQFRCLGSLQHIKNRFGSGFTVKMYLAEASCDAEAITGLMQRRFPSTYLKDQHSNMVEYHVPVAPGGVADIFDQLESNKNTLRIKHFSVSQTTLDEVFINFAMEKNDMESLPADHQLDGSDVDSLGSLNTVKT